MIGDSICNEETTILCNETNSCYNIIGECQDDCDVLVICNYENWCNNVETSCIDDTSKCDATTNEVDQISSGLIFSCLIPEECGDTCINNGGCNVSTLNPTL